MKKIVFVCLGNICRSPMAEFVMKDLVKKANLEKEFFITSAGTSGEHDGENMHYGTQNKLKSLNIKYQNFTSKKLTQALCDESDFLITMDNSVGGKIKCRKRKIKCRIFATNYLSFNLKLKL